VRTAACAVRASRKAQPPMRAIRILLATALLPALVQAVGAASPEPPPGASSCSGCHAVRRGVETPAAPLAGRTDIAQAMQAFKAGERPSTVMDRIAKGFGEAEIAAIAQWYAEQR
jgi:sulfide dehydrogenase cytochrome subunit